jgi:hypothetical protein
MEAERFWGYLLWPVRDGKAIMPFASDMRDYELFQYQLIESLIISLYKILPFVNNCDVGKSLFSCSLA